MNKLGLFKPLQTNQTTGDPFLDHVITYMSTDNSEYTSIKALRNSDVFTAVKIIASDIASSPIQLMKKDDIDEKSDLAYLFNVKPNDYSDGWHFKYCLAVNMLLNGNSYAEIVREDKAVKALHIIPNSHVSVTQKANKSLSYIVKDDKRERTLPAKDVLHFKYFTDDGLTGKSPLYSLKGELKVQEAGNKTLFNFFSRGVNGSGILKVNKSDLDLEAKKNIRENFEKANGANDGENVLRTIIMDDSMDYKPLSINTDVLKLVNSNDYNTKQIAKVFGISADRLGVENQHSSTIQSNLIYLQNTLYHYFSVFSTELVNKLIDDKNMSVKFNTDRFLEADPQAITESVIQAVNNSLLTINEGRAKLGRKPLDEGDRLLTSLNYTHLDNLDNYQRKENEQNGRSRETVNGQGGA